MEVLASSCLALHVHTRGLLQPSLCMLAKALRSQVAVWITCPLHCSFCQTQCNDYTTWVIIVHPFLFRSSDSSTDYMQLKRERQEAKRERVRRKMHSCIYLRSNRKQTRCVIVAKCVTCRKSDIIQKTHGISALWFAELIHRTHLVGII